MQATNNLAPDHIWMPCREQLCQLTAVPLDRPVLVEIRDKMNVLLPKVDCVGLHFRG